MDYLQKLLVIEKDNFQQFYELTQQYLTSKMLPTLSLDGMSIPTFCM